MDVMLLKKNFITSQMCLSKGFSIILSIMFVKDQFSYAWDLALYTVNKI